MKYMVKVKKVFHRDIKPTNILMHDDYAKICDFGVSRRLDKNTYDTMTGSPLFSSP